MGFVSGKCLTITCGLYEVFTLNTQHCKALETHKAVFSQGSRAQWFVWSSNVLMLLRNLLSIGLNSTFPLDRRCHTNSWSTRHCPNSSQLICVPYIYLDTFKPPLKFMYLVLSAFRVVG